MDAEHLLANLSDHHKAELIAASAALLRYPLQLPESALDVFALTLRRIEPPRERDVPILPPRPSHRLASESVEQARAALQAPPPIALIGRQAALERAVEALCAARPVCLDAHGSGKTAFLRALAAQPRLRTHFEHVWWLASPLPHETFVRVLALALNAPEALDVAPEHQLSLLGGALRQAKALVLCDWTLEQAQWAALSPNIVGHSAQPLEMPESESIALEPLSEPIAREYLAAQTRLTEREQQELTALIGGAPALLRLCAALLAEDDLTPSLLLDFLRSTPPEQRYTALLSEAINSFPAEYRAICHALAATPQRCLPTALIAARFSHPVAARRALTFLARRRLIELHAAPAGELCSVLFELPEALRDPECAPFDVPSPDFEAFSRVQYVEDERVARAAFLQQQGVSLTEENRPAEAREALQQALALRQALDLPYAVAETLSALGRLAYLNGETATAIACFEEAAEILHKRRDTASLEIVRLALCRAYAFAGRPEAALAILDDDSAPPSDLAALYRARGAWSEALRCYERTLTSDEDDESWLAAQVGRAETLILAGRHAEALRSAPEGSFAALWARALFHHLQGDLDGALSAYTALESITPYAWRGTVARAKSRALAAAGHLREAALLVGAEGVWYEARQPHAAFARQRLSLALYAHFCLMLGEDDEARRAAEEARALRAERADPEAEAIACCVLGRLARRAGAFEQAQESFEAALKAFTALREDAARALLWQALGDLLREQGQLERAIAAYQRALSFEPTDRHLIYLALAESFAAAGRDAESLEAGAEAIAHLHPQRETADLALLGFAFAQHAQRQARLGRAERAQVIGEHWLQLLAARLEQAMAHPEPALQVLALGLYLRSTREAASVRLIDLAERALALAEQCAPQTVAVWAARRDLAELYRQLGRTDDALEVLAPLFAPKDAQTVREYLKLWRDVSLCAARCMAQREDTAQAAAHYRRAAGYEPDEQPTALIFLELAECYRRGGDHKHAAESYEVAAAIFGRTADSKQQAEALIEAGNAHLQVRHHESAIKTFQAALRVLERTTKPEAARMAQLYADLGTAHARLGQARGAAEAFKQALRLIDQFSAPQRYAAILTAFARAEMRLGSYQSAATAYQETLQFEHPPAERRQLLVEFGEALRKLNQFEAAIRAYEQALDLPDGDSVQRAALERDLAICHAARDDYDAAQRHYMRAIACAPSEAHGALWLALGDLHRRHADLEAALSAYVGALEQLDIRREALERAQAERAIGEIQLALKRPQQAIPHLERALELEKAQPRQAAANLIALLQALAAAHEQCGDLARAAAYQHSALIYQDAQREPEACLATLSELMRLYAQLGRHGEVIKACDEALRLEATLPRRNPARLSQTYLALGKAQSALSQLDRAVQTLRQAVQLAAQPEAERALAQVQADIARYEQALAAASQSRALLERVRLPDLHSLAFVIALQAQHSLALGRLEMAQQYADELIALLRQRRHELSLAADDPTAQALLSLWRGAEAADAQLAAAEYRAALAVLQAQAQPNAALIKVVTYLLERVTA